MKVGIDLIKVNRIKKIAENLESAKKIFTPAELNYILSKRSSILEVNQSNKMKPTPMENTMAGMFSAKEAVLKAMGVGVNKGIGFADVEIGHDDLGAPAAKVSEKALKTAKLDKNCQILVNISHDGGYATAICVII